MQAGWVGGRAFRAYARDRSDLSYARLEPRVRLLRALSFQGDYASADVAVKKEIFERGRSLFEESLQLLTRSLESPLPSEPPEAIAEAVAHLPEAGPLFYWGAVHWGQWGKLFGPLEAIRKGVAKRLRDGGEVARLLVPDYEEGAPFRAPSLRSLDRRTDYGACARPWDCCVAIVPSVAG